MTLRFRRVIRKRIAHLIERIHAGAAEGRVLTYDIEERQALGWALSIVEEHCKMDMTCYEHGNVVQCELVEVQAGPNDRKKPAYLERSAAAAFIRMREAAEDDGVVLAIDDAFRPMIEQQQIWNRWVNQLKSIWLTPDSPAEAREQAFYAKKISYPVVAKPGHSNHQNGRCVDIDTLGSGHDSPVFKWLAAHAQVYGFANTVLSEPWHWEYVTSAPVEPGTTH